MQLASTPESANISTDLQPCYCDLSRGVVDTKENM